MGDLNLLGLVQLSFGLAAIANIGLLAVAPKNKASSTGNYFLLAIGLEVVWSAVNLLVSLPYASAQSYLYSAELLRLVGWALFLTSLLATLNPSGWIGFRMRRINRRNVAVPVGALLIAAGSIGLVAVHASVKNHHLLVVSLLGAVGSLVMLEQVWRNADQHRRWGLKFLAIALFLKFGLDIVIFSDSLLFNRLQIKSWAIRGLANGLVVPLLVIAAVRNTDWHLAIGISRKAVFYTSTLFVSGIFLLIVASGGYYLRTFGGDWSSVASAILIFIATTGLLIVLSSGSARAKMRVFVSKNFFTYRYDYRSEWLRLLQLVDVPQGKEEEVQSTPTDSLSFRSVEGIGQLVESTGGAIWFQSGQSGLYRCEGAMNRTTLLSPIEPAAPIIEFLAKYDTVIDLHASAPNHPEWSRDKLPSDIANDPDAVLIVPLKIGHHLFGMVVLDRLRINFPMNWEVYDMLKIAGRQLASYIAVRQSTEALMMANEFDTFNRMSAFVVHDMKNQVSQLSLILSSADKHGHDPDYQKDVIETVREVFEQMQALLLQLTSGTQKPAGGQQGAVTLGDVIESAVQQHKRTDLEASVVIDPNMRGAQVKADPALLERAIGNLIQNAIDATPATGRVTVEVTAGSQPDKGLIVVSDSGQGMTESFIRTRLFKPFTSTKNAGMGIGAFEAREYVRQIGGSMDVSSKLGDGTSFRVELPLVSPDE